MKEAAGAPFNFGPYRLDRDRGCLWRGDAVVPLRPKSWEVLLYLVERPGTLVSIDALQQAVWSDTAVTPKTLTNVIAELRRALGDNPDQPLFIETVHRRGYRFLPRSNRSAPPAEIAPEPGTVAVKASESLAVPAEFVGRAAETELLQQCWQRSLDGQRQMVFLCGEAGIGKSTLLETTLGTMAASAEAPLIGRGNCIERHGAYEAYMPVLDAIAAWAAEAPQLVTELLHHFAPTWLAEIPWLMPQRDRYERAPAAGGSATRMLREGIRFLEALAEKRPVVLAFEDLHWSDPETIDFVAAVGRGRAGRILVICTYRPIEARIYSHPIVTSANTLVRGGAVQLMVEPFTRHDVMEYLQLRLGDERAAEAAAAVVEEHSRGIPFLVRAVVDHILARRRRDEDGSPWALPEDARSLLADLPLSVRDVIETQIEILPSDDVQVLEVASVVGQSFTPGAVANAAELPLEMVGDCLARLARQSSMIERGSRSPDHPAAAGGGQLFAFTHTLYQVVLYDRLAQSRRQRLHQRIGEQLEKTPGTTAAVRASHFQRSGDHRRALLLFEEAAMAVTRRAASREAVAYLQQALAELERIDDYPARAEDELRLLASYGEAAAAAFGADSEVVERAASRAVALCSTVEEPRALFTALHALWLFSLLNGDTALGSSVVMQTTLLSNRTENPSLALLADVMVGTIACFAGWPAQGREHLERALQRLPPLRRQLPHTGIDLEIEIRLTLGWALWLLGYPDQAIASAQQAAQTATERQDPNSCTVALVYLFNVHHLRGEYDLAAARARELQAVGDEYDLYLPKRTGLIMEAAALMEQGELDRAVWRLLESEATEGAAGLQQVVRTYYLGRVAANCVCVGTPEQGLALAGEALERIQATGFATSKAEIRRIQGELLQLLEPEAMARYAGEWGSEPEAAAEWCFQQALEIARSQGARAWELRAAVSRARLWNRQGRRGEAQQQLADIYSQYSEGVATADLREAAAVLEHR